MNNYEKSWKKIDSLVEKAGLSKTALKEVDAVYASAKKEGNEVQVIKALVYKINLNEALSEQSRYENIALLEKEVVAAKEPARSILNSIAAGNYWNYLQQNRWRFYNRTATVNFKKEDLATWTLEDLNEKISALFLASISEKDILKNTSLDPYDAIIIKGNARYLRPTLYDLLAHRSLEYFQNDERGINKPAYAFEIDDSAAFADATAFSKHVFETRDTASLHYKALTIYQELLAFHLNDKKPDALIDADVKRIAFVNNHSTHPEKDSLYKKSLERLTDKYLANPTADEALYLLAQWHAEKARTYDPLRDTVNRYSFLKAINLCDKALSVNKKSSCRNLRNEILAKQVSTEAEKVNSIGQPFRVLINYRNLTTVHFRLIKLDRKTKESLSADRWDEKFWPQMVALPAFRDFRHTFPNTRDHQTHRAEIKIEPLQPGEYALLSSADENFALMPNALAVQLFDVSDIAYVNHDSKYYVVDRNTGSALSSANVQLWQHQYDQNKKANTLKKLDTYNTDKNGFFEIKKRFNRYFFIEIRYKNDHLFTDENNYSYVFNEPVEGQQKDQTFLFTDRSIYRPGQIVYFKGIVVTPKTKTTPSTIVTKRKSFVKLYNANEELVDSIEVTTNDYGSYSGRFTLPTSLLTGDFSIRDGNNQNEIRIKVEEYKRPKFYVEIPKPAGTYRLEDSVSVEAFAKSYAGNNINGASVNYRVVRRTIMPLWVRGDYLPRIWPPYPGTELEVAHGSGTTDENGKYIVKFKAIPDKSVSSKYSPVFYYDVTANVTDLNGETRSGNSSVAVGYQSLRLQLDVLTGVPADSLKQLKVSSVNMNDIFEKAEVNIAIHKLSEPARKFRERYWEQPDQFVMTRNEYYRNFPYDLYSDENDMTKWPQEKKVFDKTVTTGQDSTYQLNGTKFQPGWYLVELTTTDKFNQEVKELRYIELKDPKPAPVKYADKGELPASRVYVRNNRVYVNRIDVKLPASDKELKISYTTFRDKTLPGAVETWRVRITGDKGEKAAAELLTAMYDASLDQFNSHSWRAPDLWSPKIDYSQWSGANNFMTQKSQERPFEEPYVEVARKEYDKLNTQETVPLGRSFDNRIYGARSAGAPLEESVKIRGISSSDNIVTFNQSSEKPEGVVEPPSQSPPSIQPRSNLNETAFFFPELYTDAEGNIEFSFTTPEALTEWKWMLLAHTKDLALGYGQKTMITQKELMVQSNAPRFLREGDRIDFSAKIANMTAKEITGEAFLQLIDPTTNEPVDGIFQNISPRQYFTAAAKQSTPVNFTLTIPFNFVRPVTWRIIASSGQLSDGEESLLPVISNRMLVTETIPLPVKGNETKTFSFDKLLKSGSSASLQHYGLTVEFTSNPAWYAIQALPYLKEGTKETSEQIFNRYYANAIASKIANTSPRFKELIEKWRNSDTSALVSNLQKNEELKSLILQETPWVLEAKTESQQMKNIALLFDMTKMSAELSTAFEKLQQMQSPNGGFAWCPGGREDRYMTQYILSGTGHLKHLGALPSNNKLNLLIKAGIAYLDQQIKKDYEDIKKTNKKLPEGIVYTIPVQYLYMRSFFKEIAIPANASTAYNYFRNQSKAAWVKHNAYQKAMIALALSRTGDISTARKIMASLKETAITHPELGMYWKDMSGGYYWYQAPIEAQSVLIEAFSEISKDNSAVNDMKTWLLKNKQTNHWNTTKSTADACYALLLHGSDWTTAVPEINIKLGTTTISSKDQKAEAGTGYFKTNIEGGKLNPAMGNINVKVSSNNAGAPSWGAVYWQYFENLENITSAATPLKLDKKLFVEKNTDRGPLLQPLNDNNELNVGDKIKVRIELRADRDMEYVHMKDMRASCMEPVNVLSQYKWNSGLGYYESTKDAATDFFFDFLPKGTYVFEYPLFVTHTGTFSNGVTTIQCMYAPEFSSHSEGIKVNVEKK